MVSKSSGSSSGGLDTFIAMAEKRPLGPLGPVMYGKLPRLEPEPGPGHGLPLSAGNQDSCNYKGSPLRADNLLTNCLLYRPPTEGSGKMKDSSELLPFGPQTHTYPGPPLAAPKPVYRSPLCYGLPTCLGEAGAKRPMDVDWTLVTGPLLPSADPPCSLAPAPGKGQPLDETFLRGLPTGGPGKDSSLPFSPCQTILEKYRTIHGTGFLASKYTGPYSGDPKQAISEGSSSPWTQLAQPLGPPCQDAVPVHYPLPPPPQALPCPPPCRHPEKQGSYGSVLPLPPLGAHKGAAYQAGGLGSPYLRQQAPQTPYLPPVGIDTYSYSSVPLPAPSPGLKLEPPLAPRCPLDFVPQTLGFPYARDDLSLYGASPGLGGTPPSHSQNSVQPVPQPSAFQRTYQPLPASQPCSEPVRPAEKPAPEAQAKTWLPSCRKEQLHPRPSERLGVPIVIRDSPVPRTSPALHPCAKERQSLPQKDAKPPSSPPMPVIDNVFSLAPYRDYLDVQTPEPTAEQDCAPATSKDQDKDCKGTLPVQDRTSRPHCSLREEVALDLSVKKSMAEDVPVKVPSPEVHAKSSEAVDGPGMENTVSGLPGLKKMVTEISEVATEATPRTNFHSSVAFMFRKFKILRPAPLPAAIVPSPPTPAPAPAQPVPNPPSVPVGLQILTQPLPVACFNLALPSPPAIAVTSPAPASAPAPSAAPAPAPASAPVSRPAQVSTAASANSLEQHFTGLHTSLCEAISGSVAHSPPEKLREWLETTGPWGQAAWQDGQGVQGLLDKLLSQLQRFLCTQQCPFPHVVRAGAIFVPIHLVKERLFPKLPPSSVDHVLQEHRVELRPTTLSEERALRERALHGCTSRMLKLLALRQLPDIYPDLLGLQWHACVRRQLGDFDTEARTLSPSEPTVTRDEPESQSLAWLRMYPLESGTVTPPCASVLSTLPSTVFPGLPLSIFLHVAFHQYSPGL
ncbi:hypothetical protein STEG23_031301 [Scotinomys teguina]